MGILTLQRANARLTRAVDTWRTAAIGLLALSLTVNMVLVAWISWQGKRRRAAEARHREQIEEAEHVRDLAVWELVTMSLRWAEEQQAREAQAEAYAVVGGYRYIGECTVTAYCCEPYRHICGTGDGVTATGLPVTPGMVAVDPEVIPLGSTVVIDGRKYLAADTGVTGLCVDVAVPTHDEALERGVRTASVWIREAPQSGTFSAKPAEGGTTKTEKSVQHDYDQ